MACVPEPIKYHALTISDMSLQVKLGCSSEERSVLQEVRVSLDLHFFEQPPGTISDNLSDTICYAQICKSFENYCQKHEFSLVEKLARDLLLVSRELVHGRALISLRVHKVSPPVQGLIGGVVYRLGDFE